jgi:tagaturonate reductase
MTYVQHSVKPITAMPRKHYPIKVLQFGSGNFLRGFVDWMVQELNNKISFNAGVTIIQSISTDNRLQEQEGLFTVLLKGLKDEEFIYESSFIDCVQRCLKPQEHVTEFWLESLNPDLQFIVSNTTESGIVTSLQDKAVDELASTFPGKLTQLLYHRYKNKLNSRLVVLPTELIENNGSVLRGCIEQYAIQWKLSSGFIEWVRQWVTFCNTLVDRIVSGFPKEKASSITEELGYRDELLVEAELFHLWVIEGPAFVEEMLPFRKVGLNVVFTNNLELYRSRKVRILNGTHSAMAVIGYMAGLHTVKEVIEHPVTGPFVRRMIYDEIVPHLEGDRQELEQYTEEVINRFKNPSIKHHLLSIALNSFAKFKVRVLPSLLGQVNKNGLISKRLAFALASLFFFYRGLKAGKNIPLNDDELIIRFMEKEWSKADFSKEGMVALCGNVLSNHAIWGTNLNEIRGLTEQTGSYLYTIDQLGILDSIRELESTIL